MRPSLTQVFGAFLAADGDYRCAAASLGVSPSSVWRRLNPWRGRWFPARRRPIDDAERKRIERLLAEPGATSRSVARTVGRGHASVLEIRAAMPVDPAVPRLRPPRRCACCYHVVVLDPCQVCRARGRVTIRSRR